MTFTLTAFDPSTNQITRSNAADFYELKALAKLERKKGARVKIKNAAGETIYRLPRRKKKK